MQRLRPIGSFAALVAALLIGGVLFAVWPREPSCRGKSLSVWLKYLSVGNESQRDEARLALLDVGTNALPRLVRYMRAQESTSVEKVFAVWSEHVRMKFPFTRAGDRRMQGISAFKVLAPVNRTAAAQVIKLLEDDAAVFPALQIIDEIALTNSSAAVTKLLDHKNWMVRGNAAATLGRLAPLDSNAVAALVRCLNDPHPIVRGNAASSLSSAKHLDALAASALLHCLADTSEAVRLNSISALARCGVEARRAVPKLVDLARNDGDPDVRKNAQRVVKEIEDDLRL